MNSTLSTLLFLAIVGGGGYLGYEYLKKKLPLPGSTPPALFSSGSPLASSTNSFFNDLSNILGVKVNPNMTQGQVNGLLGSIPSYSFLQVVNSAEMQPIMSSTAPSLSPSSTTQLYNTELGIPNSSLT